MAPTGPVSHDAQTNATGFEARRCQGADSSRQASHTLQIPQHGEWSSAPPLGAVWCRMKHQSWLASPFCCWCWRFLSTPAHPAGRNRGPPGHSAAEVSCCLWGSKIARMGGRTHVGTGKPTLTANHSSHPSLCGCWTGSRQAGVAGIVAKPPLRELREWRRTRCAPQSQDLLMC
ncbi:hypothetical protein N658DRAFT_54226 [Parathielavia hyrcaniae]|uniref:Uncharacterized protein n=1 Tax=Parathielavia hyrcaniae TaxID=113614 RepID=A0AAN6T1W6_9PEZI|nr:hypothetical protein N658DRAFT_54226 [Parathielavia hyrcaniae]